MWIFVFLDSGRSSHILSVATRHIILVAGIKSLSQSRLYKCRSPNSDSLQLTALFWATILAELQPLAYILERRITPNSKNLSDFQVRKDRDKAKEILEDPLNTLTRRTADSGRDREIPSHSERELVYVPSGERSIYMARSIAIHVDPDNSLQAISKSRPIPPETSQRRVFKEMRLRPFSTLPIFPTGHPQSPASVCQRSFFTTLDPRSTGSSLLSKLSRRFLLFGTLTTGRVKPLCTLP